MLLALCAAACQAERSEAPGVAEQRPALGLMTSLPIYWGEPAQMTDLLNGSTQPHRVRKLLEDDYTLLPLDALGTADGRPVDELARLDRLLLAQPRALTPADNVALDRWVRSGGHLLLVLDPMMTDHSAYPIGDKRRFNDVALIPPVLEQWGLRLAYQAGAGPRLVTVAGTQLPIEEYGTLSLAAGSAGEVQCSIESNGVMARCRIGNGVVLVVADAAFLNHEADEVADHAVDAVLASAFG